jgi:hypothetical protein
VEFLEEVSHCCLNRRFETGTTFVIAFPSPYDLSDPDRPTSRIREGPVSVYPDLALGLKERPSLTEEGVVARKAYLGTEHGLIFLFFSIECSLIGDHVNLCKKRFKGGGQLPGKPFAEGDTETSLAIGVLAEVIVHVQSDLQGKPVGTWRLLGRAGIFGRGFWCTGAPYHRQS